MGRAGQWGQGDYPRGLHGSHQLLGNPRRSDVQVGRARAQPEQGLVLKPCRGPPLVPGPLPDPVQASDTGQGLGKGCSLRGPVAPSLFSSCLFQHYSPPSPSVGRMPCPLNGGQE